MTTELLPEASLASGAPYPVPAGARLEFHPTRRTTDGFLSGNVHVVFEGDRPSQVVARNVPTQGGTRAVKALGDYAKLFPEPLAVAPGSRLPT